MCRRAGSCRPDPDFVDRTQGGEAVRIRDRVPKVNGSGAHRECTPEQTYERVRPHFGRIGIDHVLDLTGRDRLGIPVYQAVVPRPVDGAPGYWGKGLTPID